MLYSDPNDRQRCGSTTIEQLPRGVAVEWRGSTRTARRSPLESGSSPNATRPGNSRIIDGYVEDVTPIRATEQALRQSEKLAALGRARLGRRA